MLSVFPWGCRHTVVDLSLAPFFQAEQRGLTNEAASCAKHVHTSEPLFLQFLSSMRPSLPLPDGMDFFQVPSAFIITNTHLALIYCLALVNYLGFCLCIPKMHIANNSDNKCRCFTPWLRSRALPVLLTSPLHLGSHCPF